MPDLLFAAVGDVHGDCAAMARAIEVLATAHGPLAFVLAVGDTEFNRSPEDAAGVTGPRWRRQLGDFPSVVDGTIRLPAPIFFIGGNHEPYPALDAHGPGVWAATPGGHAVTFLGRAGVVDVVGLRVAFLSGIYSCKVSEASTPVRVSKKDRTYWTHQETATLRAAARDAHIDVFVSHDWPAGFGTSRDGEACGNHEVRSLLDDLRPALSLHGHMHHPQQGRICETDVVALGLVGRPGGAAAFALERGGVRLLGTT